MTPARPDASTVRVYRGRRATREADRAATRELVEQVGETEVPAIRVWRPGRQVAFGRRDTRADGYAEARAAAEDQGFPPVERSVGGRAVAYAETTLAFAHAVPTDGTRQGLDERYERAVETVTNALRECGAAVEAGEPAAAYCPGDYSVSAVEGGKIAGIAQRVRQDAALVAGSVTVAERAAIREVLVPVYDALGVEFDAESVGSVAAAGGPDDPKAVRSTLEDALVGDRERALRDVTAL
ncbi:MAG: biotin/lipoate A/B protein ligase family protein [Halobaculum sp.]